MEIRLSNEEMQYIALAENVTNASFIDCIEMDDRVTFIVENGKLGKAIGKNAKNLKRLENMLNKEIKFVENDPDTEQFVRNLFKPFDVEEVVVMEGEDGVQVNVTITPEDKGKAIGANGRNINILREIARRHHNVTRLKVL
ncbi:MAG: NusA-like transcription termination signal-binding factor [Thermoplasmatota archaeon]